jgi:hypothetical protein
MTLLTCCVWRRSCGRNWSTSCTSTVPRLEKMDREMARHSGTAATIDCFYFHRLKRPFRTCRSLPPRLRARGCRDNRMEGASGAGGRGRALLHAPPRLHARRGWGIAAGRCCTLPPCLTCERVSGSRPGCRMPPRVMQPPTRLRTRRCRGRGRVVKCPHAFACEGVSVSRLGCTPHAFASEGVSGWGGGRPAVVAYIPRAFASERVGGHGQIVACTPDAFRGVGWGIQSRAPYRAHNPSHL